MDGTGELHVNQSKPGSKSQRSCFSSYVEARPAYINTYMIICSERANKIILASLSKGTMGGERRKENVRE
jgi:hypothetical protein